VGVCLIDAECYADGFVDPTNAGQRCISGRTNWTIIESEWGKTEKSMQSFALTNLLETPNRRRRPQLQAFPSTCILPKSPLHI